MRIPGPRLTPTPARGPAAATSEPADAPRRRRTATRLAALATAAAAAVFVAVRRDRTHALDLALSLRVQAAATPPIPTIMWAVSQPGFPPLSRVIPAAIIATLWRTGHRLEAGLQALSWSAALIAEGLKLLVRRPRPLPPAVRVAVANLGGSSFPSGHVLGYVGVYGFAAHLAGSLVRPAAARNALVAPALALVALVGPSRVYLGHHWPTDVAASYLLGFAWLTGMTGLHRRLRGEQTP